MTPREARELFSDRLQALAGGMVQPLALIVHELATNAVKYGALSQPKGKVSVAWEIEGTADVARFIFRWRERDGPRSSSPPEKGS